MDIERAKAQIAQGSSVLHEINVTARQLHSDDPIEGFHISAGQTHSSDQGIVITTLEGGAQIRFLWDAHIAVMPHTPDGDFAFVYVEGSGSVFDETFNSYIELVTDLGRVEPTARGGQMDDGRWLFIISDLQAPDEPHITIRTVNNGSNHGQSWDLDRLKIEFHGHRL